MEVIYYMRNYYPLTAAQKMHHNWILDYGTQQVSGVSVVASVQAELDFGLLKKCIQMETERSGCTRVRFTKPDKEGNVKQYIEKQDPRDIELKDLSGMESLAKADELMQQWAYETFDGDDIPMCEFTMLKLPEGYNGFFVHMDHRLIDSCGLVVMIGDLFQLYTYYKYGTAYPQELADFETVLKKDLAKAGNEKRFAKDKKFWDDQLDALGEPLYSDIQGPSVLEEARKRHGNPKLRSSDIEMKDLFVAVKDYYLEPGPTKNLIDFCMNHQLSMTNLLLLGIRTYLSKVNNGQEDITIQNFISRRSTHDEWTSGGSRTIMFPCRTVITPETDFLSAAYEIQNMQNRIYMHSNYDPAFIMDEMRKRYNTPEHTGYESCYLTYQPMTVKVENEMLGTIRQHAKWFATVPKVNVIIGKAYGTAYVAMNSKSIGADLVYAWDNAEIGMMDASLAAKIMYADADAATIGEKAAEYAALQSSVDQAAARGYVDTIINPEDTRKYVAAAFEMLFDKREVRADKKHGTV